MSEEGRIAVRAAAEGSGDGPAEFLLALHDARLSVLEEARGGELEVVGLEQPVSPGRYYLVISQARSAPPLTYRLEARLVRAEPVPAPAATPPPPAPAPRPREASPPPPAVVTLSARILEIEGRPEQQRSVLIDRGSDAGLRPGLRGLLVDRGRVLGRLEITEVYADGSRARLIDGLDGSIGPDTRAQIRLSGE